MRQFLYKLPAKIPRSTEELLRWYERFISPLTLLIGFTLDNFALRRVDFFWGNVLLFSYLALAASCIVLFHLIHSGRLRGRLFLFLLPFTTIAIQFGFGGLFSGFVILYSRSAGYAASWVFVVLLALLMIGNERFRRHYTKFAFQGSILFLALLTLLLFFVPLIYGAVGTAVFFASQLVAVGLTILFVRGFALILPDVFREAKWTLRKSLASILLLFNVLYFTNAIPPLPLALKETGVYHDVRRVGDVYELQAEPRAWYERYFHSNTVYHRAPGERVYVFTAIFAPNRLHATIVHEWEWYDPSLGKWVVKNSVAFLISGGRDKGYRGYTILDSVKEGDWRVNVKTGEKLIGRIGFRVENVEEKAVTVTEEH